MKPTKPKCSGRSNKGRDPCVFNGCRIEDGKWWCNIHAPSMKAMRVPGYPYRPKDVKQ